ncbi:hypothetical protein EB796_011202 [Bugula neritina]|uniref:UPAR/Ly6 domain-containing protein n=1 Tax=Bugula neritina TaxID=10212 RepID=A0A7J7JX39_BUGNE|nr:hypothetical protein EB796_011202 [Bugula neritina]
MAWAAVQKLIIAICFVHHSFSTTRKCYECSSTDDDNLCKPGEAIPDDVIPVDCPYGYDFCKTTKIIDDLLKPTSVTYISRSCSKHCVTFHSILGGASVYCCQQDYCNTD